MLMLAVALTLADAALGAPYPGATLVEGPRVSAAPDPVSGTARCFVEYKLHSAAPIAAIARFYLDQGRDEQARLLGDTGERFGDYRTITFADPNFMVVVLSRQNKVTSAKVTLRMPDGCRAPVQSAN